MINAHMHGSGGYHNKYDRKVKHDSSYNSKKSTVSLVFMLALIVGMACYIGSFYWDRKPLPEVTKKHKPKKTESHSLPASFDRNFG